MFNHGRTLLLNRRTDVAAFPANELVPQAFTPVSLPSWMQSVRSKLFGASPDDYMMLYRVRQYMTVIHATPLVDWLLELDSRITYEIGNADARLSVNDLYKPQVSQISGTPDDQLTVLDVPAAPDASGRMFHSYTVEILSNTTVEVKRAVPPIQSDIYNYALVSGSTAKIPLVFSGYTFRMNTQNPGASWLIDIINRPQQDIGAVLASLTRIGEPVLLELFGLEQTEPWMTFRNVWSQNGETPMRLAALLLALIWRIDAVRRQNG